jgi:serine/threonine protein kinase
MSANFERIEAVFSQAVECRPEERAAFLAGACDGDAELRAKVQALLQAHESAEGFLPAEPRNQAPAGPIAEQPGDRIGHYKLLQQIGEGGCGVEYVAEQEHPVRRRVALKIIKPGMDTKQIVARFEAERQALALMDHPNIARIYDAGVTGPPLSSPGEGSPFSTLHSARSAYHGRPYFVMELVRGVKITDYCDQNHLPTPQRLDLFIQVCRAIQHAHQKGIIHRDIKPSNILVTINDGVPVPKVIDFGIAKATQGRLTDQTLFTAFEQFIGTPAYMSPEQAAMTSLDIDTRSDIYSLGVLLYELLTGQTPFDTKELLAAGLDEMRRTICEKEPQRPSTRLRRTALTTPGSASPPHSSPLSSDLDWIVMKCLEKDRTRRYETANGLARDIERHLNHEPVVARPPSALYEFQKAVRQHWVGFGAATAVVGALGLGVVASSWEAVRATKAHSDEVAARQRADRAARVATKAEIAARVAETNALRQAYSASLLSASEALENAQIAAARHYLDSAPTNLRGWEWRHLSSRLDLTTRVQERPRSEHAQVHVLPDGRSYYEVCAEPTNCIQRWDIDTGQCLATIPTGHACRQSWLIVGGTQLVTRTGDTGSKTNTIQVWDLFSVGRGSRRRGLLQG